VCHGTLYHCWVETINRLAATDYSCPCSADYILGAFSCKLKVMFTEIGPPYQFLANPAITS
jgi:hypothetical protein